MKTIILDRAFGIEDGQYRYAIPDSLDERKFRRRARAGLWAVQGVSCESDKGTTARTLLRKSGDGWNVWGKVYTVPNVRRNADGSYRLDDLREAVARDDDLRVSPRDGGSCWCISRWSHQHGVWIEQPIDPRADERSTIARALGLDITA
jgi:hypothetical protein